MNNIKNLVFYNDGSDSDDKVVVFYNDGTYKDISFEQGLDLCEEYVKTNNITSKEDFRSIINNGFIYRLSQDEFALQFGSLIHSGDNKNREKVYTRQNIGNSNSNDGAMDETESKSDAAHNLVISTPTKDDSHDEFQEITSVDFSDDSKDDENSTSMGDDVPVIDTDFAEIESNDSDNLSDDEEKKADDISHQDESNPPELSDNASSPDIDSSDIADQSTDNLIDDTHSDNDDSSTLTIDDSENKNDEGSDTDYDQISDLVEDNDGNDDILSDFDDYAVDNYFGEDYGYQDADYDDIDRIFNGSDDDLLDLDDEDIFDEVESDFDDDELTDEDTEYTGIRGMLHRAWNKIKRNKIVSSIIACVVSLAIGLGFYSVASRKTLEGRMNESNLNSIFSLDNTDSDQDILVFGDNSYYDDYGYDSLLKVTEDSTIRHSMKVVGDTLINYNSDFASAHMEDGSDIKAALTFDEVVALQNVYNSHDDDVYESYFNGYKLNADDTVNNYKNASIQLRDAYIIETNDNPVDMSGIILSKEGKQFYNRYHKMFLDAKSAEGKEKASLVEKLYSEAKKDFAENDIADIDNYKYSVTPMFAACSLLFDSVDTKTKLSDLGVDFNKNIGLVDSTKEIFSQIESITADADTFDSEPLYLQYRNSIVDFLDDNDASANIDNRDLSKMSVYKKMISAGDSKSKTDKVSAEQIADEYIEHFANHPQEESNGVQYKK